MTLPGFVRPAPARLLDEAESVGAVLLAILLAHVIGARHVNWAAFSGYMVMRGHWADSLGRGVLRILGTAAGAGLALLLAPGLVGLWPMQALAVAGVGGLTLYGAIAGKRAYAWLFVGLTFQMILLDAGGAEPPGPFAATRLLEVTAGTAACVGVSVLSALTLRRRWPGSRMPAAQRLGWHGPAARHAGQAAAALLLLVACTHWIGLAEPAQGAVSIMATMLIPATSLGTSGLVPVSRKLGQRVMGCLAGSGLAAGALLLARGEPTILLAATALGVAIGRHLENSGRAYAYVGTQFTLAVLVTLVPDNYDHAAIAPALERLGGILIGRALLEPVLIAWHLLAPSAPPRPTPSGPAEE
jgi:uncharacterized membrane protein YccC